MIETLRASIDLFWRIIADNSSFVVSQAVANFNEVVAGFKSGGLEAFGALFPLIILILQLNVLLVILKTLQMIWFLLQEVKFPWKKLKSYSVLHPDGQRILIIGDSTAYGTGALSPEDTLSGRLAHDFPRTEILNNAVNGSLTKDALRQLREVGSKKFDMIIISTGGNDIWHFTGLSSLERDLRQLLKEAVAQSDHRVILLFYANLGHAPIFPSGIRWLLGRRTERVHQIFSVAAASFEVPLIELYTSKNVNNFTPNPFLEDPKKYYAKDRMHPSSEGYRLWYNRMWGEMRAHNFAFSELEPTLAVAKEVSAG
ncbi:MAG: SGNH/GDSL hydrolase family protein [Minisyncoccota bacterium]